jgi:hypothetical protein
MRFRCAEAPVVQDLCRHCRPEHGGEDDGGLGFRIVKVKGPPRRLDPADWRRHVNERLRLEFIAGAEAQSRNLLGRGLTAEELALLLRNYPGDISA